MTLPWSRRLADRVTIVGAPGLRSFGARRSVDEDSARASSRTTNPAGPLRRRRARAAPRRADRPLLPHARLGRRRRRRRPGDDGARLAQPRSLRRSLVAAHLALPHRHPRLPRRARRSRRAASGPIELGPAGTVDDAARRAAARRTGSSRSPTPRRSPRDADPPSVAMLRQSIRLAFVAALQHLPPKQRAALLLTEVLGWSAAEVADGPRHLRRRREQRAPARPRDPRERATVAATRPRRSPPTQAALVDRYVDAFERYDVDALVALLHEDATLSMPPYTLWLQGREPIRALAARAAAPAAAARASCRRRPAAPPRSASTARRRRLARPGRSSCSSCAATASPP